MSKLFTLLLLPLLLTPVATSDDHSGFVYAGCSQQKYDLGSAYELNVDSILSSVSSSAAFSSYSNFTSSSASSSSPAYGLFQCRGDLSPPDCQSCLRTGLSQVGALCPSAAGAALQLQGCFLRYDKDPFLGRLDTTLVLKKCGAGFPAGQYDSDVLGMRDAGLGQLQGEAPGMYRTGEAGYVQSLAQCDGDISPKECGDCVAAAVGQVKSGCGLTVGADVYLAKCYVKYWSNGIYGHKSSIGDETGKTLAIIIGLLAGVALIIVFLSFIRRGSGGGK